MPSEVAGETARQEVRLETTNDPDEKMENMASPREKSSRATTHARTQLRRVGKAQRAHHSGSRSSRHRDYAFAGRNMRITLPNALSMTGQNKSTIASVGDRADQAVRREHLHVAAGADHRQAERILGAIAEHER